MSTELNSLRNRYIYCHFSFKRPKGKDYGLFAVAFYNDFEGKRLIGHLTKRQRLWQNHQFITAIQSYNLALDAIYQCQGRLKALGITQVMLVTDNSTLAGWIVDPTKNKNYTATMDKAVEPYRIGSPKEIVIGIGLCEARKSEKSYKYCKEELAVNELNDVEDSSDSSEIEDAGARKIVNNRIVIGDNYKSAIDILNESGELY